MPVPGHMNPAEHVLDLINVDFAGEGAQSNLDHIVVGWHHSQYAERLRADLKSLPSSRQLRLSDAEKKPSFISQVSTLLRRAFIKSFRDLVAYWVRVAMYMGLAIMMGTVWLRLDPSQKHIQPFINAIVSGARRGLKNSRLTLG